jgi:hypothetical protein
MKVLIITLRNWWLGVSRLPLALHKAGFEVAAWCPHDSFLARTGGVTRHFPWNGAENWSRRLRAIVAEWQPEMIIPGDETMAHFLRKIAAQSPLLHPENAALRQLLRASMGDPRTTRTLDGKIAFQRMAADLGLRTPDDRAVKDAAAALATAGGLGYPVVLKDEYAAGGIGVKICATPEALRASWDELEQATPRPRSLRQKLVHLAKAARGGQQAKRRSLQRFIQGKPAFHAVAALAGQRLAGVTAIVEVSDPPGTGPSCVIRLCEVPEISIACEKIIRATGMSGFAGFDFMVEAETGNAYVLECNPRPTPVSHLGGLVGSDLCAALWDALHGTTATGSGPKTPAAKEQWVAFYPQEMLRDPHSPYLRTAYVDFPHDDLPLMQALRERNPGLGEPPQASG